MTEAWKYLSPAMPGGVVAGAVAVAIRVAVIDCAADADAGSPDETNQSKEVFLA